MSVQQRTTADTYGAAHGGALDQRVSPAGFGPVGTGNTGAAISGRRARIDTAVRLGLLIATWSSLLLVAYWWASGGGITDLSGWESGLISTGRLTGLTASILLLVQVLLMARIPLLEGAFGQDRLARVHRLVGLCSFDLMVAHIVLITWGYAAGQFTRTPSTLWDLTIHYPGMLLAAGGTVCLIMVVVTSVRSARRKLRYESWHLLHLYAYLGVGFALPHQLWTGQEFLASTARTVFWWSWWIAAIASVVCWRLVLPLWRSARHRIRVESVEFETPGIVSVHMGVDGAPIRAEAGQFFNFRFLNGQGWSRAHPYSLSAAPEGGHLRITAKIVGDGSAALTRLRPGTRVLVEGPYGRLGDRARTRRRIALIGAGVGVTPLRALAESATYAPGEAILLYRFSGTPLFEDELRRLAAVRGLQVALLPGHRRYPGSWLGAGSGPGADAETLTRWIPDIVDRDVYVCGPSEWAADVRRSTEVAGLPEDRFHVESFGW